MHTKTKYLRLGLTYLTALLGLLLPGLWVPDGFAAAAGPIVVASIHAQTGDARGADTTTREGVILGAAEINRTGGVLGRTLKLVEIDNRSTPIGSKLAASAAVKMNVVAIVGPSWSSHALAAAKVAQQHGTPMVTDMATHEAVTRIGDYIFRVCFTNAFQGRVMARFARDTLHASSAFIFVDLSSDYSMSLARQFDRSFRNQGGRILASVSYKRKTIDSGQFTTLAWTQQPDVIFVPGHDESAVVVQAARRAGLTGIAMGGDGWSIPEFLKKGGNTLALGYYCAHWHQSLPHEISRAFVNHFSPDRPPGSGTALGYDAIRLVAAAIEKAGHTDPEAIRRALAETHDFESLSGPISFDQNGDPIKPVVIMKLAQGRTQYLQSIMPR